MHNSLHVLHADDDAEDRWLFREGILEVDAKVTLVQFEDGTDLLNYLADTSSAAPVVHLIVCDMQMRQVGGLGVLQVIKTLNSWKEVPVIIFSTSSFDGDIKQCLARGAAGFFSKPGTYSENLEAIRQMISAARLPVTSPLH